MISYYSIDKNKIQESELSQSNWIHLEQPTSEEVQVVIECFHLPQDIFIATDRPDIVARLEKIPDDRAESLYEFVVFSLDPHSALPMEQQLQPLSFIFSEDLVITCSYHQTTISQNLLSNYAQKINSIPTFIVYAILCIYRQYIRELDVMKETIDKLDRDARQTMSADELFLLADTERELVFLDHTLKDQATAVQTLWQDTDIIQQVNNPALIYDVKLAQRHAEKLINIYRDLLTTIGGLFSDMMSHRLNLLMKFLNSAALILSVPTLVSGIWGMNSQVPGEGSQTGFYLVIIFGALLTFLFALYLKHKDFTK
ncbi:magnesium transporter [Ignavigranum ruoffiae]|uniref:Magnesium transporter n=1 Tax=Ignavigranum ruoffiae TaxID=89093 RepID=A0A1H9FJF7_9LACT|nr:magnesium transporter CorA family protein [Ignavigranum ruoffiae]SEQ38071.1 magnesium transporter [Ignavigranum ruoffiae]